MGRKLAAGGILLHADNIYFHLRIYWCRTFIIAGLSSWATGMLAQPALVPLTEWTEVSRQHTLQLLYHDFVKTEGLLKMSMKLTSNMDRRRAIAHVLGASA